MVPENFGSQRGSLFQLGAIQHVCLETIMLTKNCEIHELYYDYRSGEQKKKCLNLDKNKFALGRLVFALRAIATSP